MLQEFLQDHAKAQPFASCPFSWCFVLQCGSRDVTFRTDMVTSRCMQMVPNFRESALNQCTVQPFTESDDTRCCVNTIFPPEDGHVYCSKHVEDNSVTYILLKNKELCIKVGK